MFLLSSDDLIFFFNLSGTLSVLNGLDPDQDQYSVDLIWVQTDCKGYQQTTKVTASKKRGFKKYEDRFYILCLLTHLPVKAELMEVIKRLKGKIYYLMDQILC